MRSKRFSAMLVVLALATGSLPADASPSGPWPPGAGADSSPQKPEDPTTSPKPPEEGAGTPGDTDQAKKIAKEVHELLKPYKTFQAGLSVGWRIIPRRKERQLRDATISPVDGSLLVDEADASSVVLSGVVVAYPFQRDPAKPDATNPKLHWLGFLVNINLADFTAENVGVFNKSIEGGIGLAFRLNPEFAIGLTVERAFSRSLREGIPVGQPLMVDGKELTAIDKTDDRFFHEDNVTAISIKLIYGF